MGKPVFSKRDESTLVPPYTHEADGTPVMATSTDIKWDEQHPYKKQKFTCLVPDTDKPMIFKNQPYCSDECRKLQGVGPKEGYRGRNAG